MDQSAIKELIIARFDAHSAVEVAKRSASADLGGDPDAESEESRPQKKRKRDPSTEQDDAKLAARLQEQENQRARARSTRTGGAVAKKKTIKKSAKKVRPEDDGALDEGSDEPKKKRGGGFQKPFNLSDELFNVCGEKQVRVTSMVVISVLLTQRWAQLSRPQVVKKLWEYIKANELQDPNDRKQIMCDEKLQAVFSIERTNAFSMNKFLGKHLYPVDE